MTLGDIVPWRYPVVRDFLYGEWLRPDYATGFLPDRVGDPNLPVLLASGREHSHALLGPPLTELVDAVSQSDVARAMFDALPALLGDLDGDERSVLLTLARMVHTLRTAHIVPKDTAAAAVGASLSSTDAKTLQLAVGAYRGETRDDWTELGVESVALATTLTDALDALRS